MREHKISERYARSIFAIAQEQKNIDTVFKDLNFIKSIVENSKELTIMIKSPLIKPDKKQAVIQEIFKDSVSDLTLNFISLLATKHRINFIASIALQFETLYNIELNRVNISITTAVDLDNNTKSNLSSKLGEMTKKTVIPTYILDNSIKAGIKVQIGDWVYDASLQNRMEDLYDRLAYKNN